MIEKLARSWLNANMRVWVFLLVLAMGAVFGVLIVNQLQTNDAKDRQRDRIAQIERVYQSDIRTWENAIDEFEACHVRVQQNDALREDLLGLNRMLHDVIQIVEDVNPATDSFGVLFDVVSRNRADIEANHAPFPVDYCPAAPPPEPVRPPELG